MHHFPGSDPRLFACPHPVRSRESQAELSDGFSRAFPEDWTQLTAALRDFKQGLPTLLAKLPDLSPEFRDMFFAMALAPGGTDLGPLAGILTGLRFHHTNSPLFRCTDELVEQLDRTDFGPDIPVGYLRPPFPLVYIELGTKRTIRPRLRNPESGEHVLEGCYVAVSPETDDMPELLNFVLVGSPVGHSHHLDDTTFHLTLSLEDLAQPLDEAIAGSFRTYRIAAACEPLPELAHIQPEDEPVVRDALLLVAKALVYIGLPQARTATHTPYSDGWDEVLRKKNAAKARKAAGRLSYLYDYTEVGLPAADPAARSPAGASPAAHWRRGHFRNQRHGPGWQQTKIVWIQPTLVGDLAAVKDYRVG